MCEKELWDISGQIREDVFRTVCENRTGHLASSLSCVDILVALYFGGILRFDPQNPEWEERDRFILSKGHAALALYYTLARAGYFAKEMISSFCMEGTIFGGLAMYGKIPGIEATTGSLGHGLSFASGVAIMGNGKNEKYNVYTLVGEGELGEGENWEAAAFIAHHNLVNHTLIIDKNNIQATGFNRDILSLDDLGAKWRAFGFDVIDVDGHNIMDIIKALETKTLRPKVIIAHTIKGKGVSFLENRRDCHYYIPNMEEYINGLNELKDIRMDT